MQTAALDLRTQVSTLASLTRGQDELGARAAARSGNDAEAAEAFQSVFARMLVGELRRALPDGLFGKGPGADVYEGWFDEHLGQSLVERDSLGLAGLVKTAIGQAADAENEAPNGGTR